MYFLTSFNFKNFYQANKSQTKIHQIDKIINS